MIERLRRGHGARHKLVESHLSRTIAYQVRAIRERLGWSQAQLAEEVGSNQNAIYRLESPHYGKATLTTLKKVATAMDVALVVRFVPFSELIDWVSGTPRIDNGLDYAMLAAPAFEIEEKDGVFEQRESRDRIRKNSTTLERPVDAPAATHKVVDIRDLRDWYQKDEPEPESLPEVIAEDTTQLSDSFPYLLANAK